MHKTIYSVDQCFQVLSSFICLFIICYTNPTDNKVDGVTFLLLDRDELNEIVKSVETIQQLQKLQTQLLEPTVSVLCNLYSTTVNCVLGVIKFGLDITFIQ